MNWYLAAMKKYATFSGRARRKEYWMFALFNMIFAITLLILEMLLFKTYGILYYIYVLAIIVPSISVLVRRLHDVGKSGSWFFISFVPLIGSIWLLVLTCTEGEKGENIYGPDPKNESSFNNDALDSHLTN